MLEILQQPLPKSGNLVIKSILDALPLKSYKVYATGLSFDKKDVLKQRGYWWDADKKCWHYTVTGDDEIKVEVYWLKSEVYGGKSASEDIEIQNYLTRFSTRAGNKVTKII